MAARFERRLLSAWHAHGGRVLAGVAGFDRNTKSLRGCAPAAQQSKVALSNTGLAVNTRDPLRRSRRARKSREVSLRASAWPNKPSSARIRESVRGPLLLGTNHYGVLNASCSVRQGTLCLCSGRRNISTHGPKAGDENKSGEGGSDEALRCQHRVTKGMEEARNLTKNEDHAQNEEEDESDATEDSVEDFEDSYLELKQLKDIKSAEFYEKEGERRRYFYYIDLQGRLFLEDIVPKNIATSLKSEKFLTFFFSQLRCNDRGEHLDYPFASPCGKELNFVKVADTPIVFHDLEDDLLTYGGTQLHEPFEPSSLRMSEEGRLYHPITKHRKLAGQMGLLRSRLAIQLSKYIEDLPQGEEGHKEDEEDTDTDTDARGHTLGHRGRETATAKDRKRGKEREISRITEADRGIQGDGERGVEKNRGRGSAVDRNSSSDENREKGTEANRERGIGESIESGKERTAAKGIGKERERGSGVVGGLTGGPAHRSESRVSSRGRPSAHGLRWQGKLYPLYVLERK